MIAKKGNVKDHHFAHQGNYVCDEWSAHKGEWHITMQNLFPKETQEIILEAGEEKHIADVCLQKPCGQRLVIEFQDSPMNYKDFLKRTIFWKKHDADMIWAAAGIAIGTCAGIAFLHHKAREWFPKKEHECHNYLGIG